jgi:PilZ domain
MDERDSMEWIRRAGDYRTLMGKRDQLGFPLGEVERARLSELEQFFAASADPNLEPYAQREQDRMPISVVVTYSNDDAPARLGLGRDISGHGLFVETRTPLRVGERTVVRVLDKHTGDDWRFGAEVVRLETGERGGMGLRFVGIPLSLRTGHRPAPHPAPRHQTRRAA